MRGINDMIHDKLVNDIATSFSDFEIMEMVRIYSDFKEKKEQRKKLKVNNRQVLMDDIETKRFLELIPRVNITDADDRLWLEYTKKLLDMKPSKTPFANMSDKEIFVMVKNCLKKHHFPDKYAIEIVSLVIEYKTKEIIAPILLTGNPGIGKTEFGIMLAEILNKAYYIFSASEATSGNGILGNSTSYKKPDCGEIMKGIIKTESAPVIIIDEVDKTIEGHETVVSPDAELLEVFNNPNSRIISDKFLKYEYDISPVVFVITGNDPEKISEPLKDRCYHIELDDVTLSNLIGIIYDYAGTHAGLYQGHVKYDKDSMVRAVTELYNGGVHSIRKHKDLLDSALRATYAYYLEHNDNYVTAHYGFYETAIERLSSSQKKVGFVL